MDSVGNRVPVTLDAAALWHVHGGANFLCCKWKESCYDYGFCFEVEIVNLPGDALWCRASKEWETTGSNQNHCAPSEDPEDECDSEGSEVCLRRRPCKVEEILEDEFFCVADEDAQWVDVVWAPEWCDGPECPS